MSPRRTLYNRGFTLVELVVTVGIFALISTLIITRNSQFDEEIFLSDMAYDVALSLRKAQSYGINVRGAEGSFDLPYGVYLTAGTSTYQLFVDTNIDGMYNAPEELIETYTLGRGTTIGALCDPGSKNFCALDDLTVIFQRPEPDAVIQQGSLSRAVIALRASRGEERFIFVESTGQFSIQREFGEDTGKEGDTGEDDGGTGEIEVPFGI